MDPSNQASAEVNSEISDSSKADTVPLKVHEKVKLELLQLKRKLLTNQRENQNIPAKIKKHQRGVPIKPGIFFWKKFTYHFF